MKQIKVNTIVRIQKFLRFVLYLYILQEYFCPISKLVNLADECITVTFNSNKGFLDPPPPLKKCTLFNFN